VKKERIARVGWGKKKPGQRVGGAGELEALQRPDRDVGALSGLERADVRPTKNRGAATGRKLQRIPCCHRLGPVAPACNEQRLLHLQEEVAPLVWGRAVDPRPT